MAKTKFSPAVQTLVNNVRRVGPPARRPSRRLFDRCTTLHDGQRITFDLSQARTCPPGFTGLKNGGGVRVVSIVKKSAAVAAGPRKTRAKKAAAPKRKKAAKKSKKKAKKKNGNGNGNGNGHTMTVASVRERLAKLYKAKKVGEASKLRAKARKAGLAI